MVKARLCFDLTLPALPEEVIQQVRGVLHMVQAHLPDGFLADDLWFCLNQRHFSNKSHHVAAAVPEDNDELEEAVAVLNMQPKLHQPKKALPQPPEVWGPDVEVC